MKILAVETTQACSVALLDGDEVSSREDASPRAATRQVLPMVESLLGDAGLAVADLDALAFGRGPGGFTGLRIAAGVVQGLAFGGGLPVVPVSSLATFAQGAFASHGCRRVLVCVDARLDEVYWGSFVIDEAGLARPAAEERLSAPDAVTPDGSDAWFAAGSGWDAYPQIEERLAGRLEGRDAALLPSAADVARLAADGFPDNAVEAAQAQPVYLRNEVAWRKSPPPGK
ncbi:MAG: tRNA (adenosine(37)-N6)-threonylcarbamoyltransferase complex dimerization subunit type 1 TsaB [Pseudomonadota bacterium]